jgi:hypothetical protein
MSKLSKQPKAPRLPAALPPSGKRTSALWSCEMHATLCLATAEPSMLINLSGVDEIELSCSAFFGRRRSDFGLDALPPPSFVGRRRTDVCVF